MLTHMLTDFVRFLISFIRHIKCNFDELDHSVVTEYKLLAFRKDEDDSNSRNSHREHSKAYNRNTTGRDRGGLS